MMRILSAKQIRELDANTIAHEPVASIDLMERACHAFVQWFAEHIEATKKIGIVCGTGNNGGDGLGIARMLNDWNYSVKVWIVRGPVPESTDFQTNLSRLKDKRIEIFDIINESDKGLFHDRDVLIDAVFGSGLSRTPEGIYAQVINCINQTDVTRIAVDIPSGLMADSCSAEPIVKAHYTVSFQMPKLAFLFPGSHPYVGKWTMVDIGLNKSYIKNTDTPHFYFTAKDARRMIRKRSTFDHKGTFGHSLLIAGSSGKIGAAVLSARAALRSGTGLLTIHIPRCGYQIIQSSVPEAMASIDLHEDHVTECKALQNYSAVGIGPGLDQHPETVKAFRKILEEYKRPMVIDADALNMLAVHSELLSLVPAGSILTPHPKEFERIVGNWTDDFHKLEKLKTLASQLKSVVVLKGAYSAVATADKKVYFNSSGNPGMATGGSGDVLTGILTGLLAQRYDSADAARLGVYLHGLAGDLAVQGTGEYSLIASDLIHSLPAAFQRVLR
ncbi:MAG TPA: NAD(P)H-hydrate dehydratase [Ohtaekwangia sp.]